MSPVSGPLSREVIDWRCRYCDHIDGDGKESAPHVTSEYDCQVKYVSFSPEQLTAAAASACRTTPAGARRTTASCSADDGPAGLHQDPARFPRSRPSSCSLETVEGAWRRHCCPDRRGLRWRAGHTAPSCPARHHTSLPTTKFTERVESDAGLRLAQDGGRSSEAVGRPFPSVPHCSPKKADFGDTWNRI